MQTSADRPITLLIAALGGEGGGVLASWIVAAAESRGLPVQSTSIPGVAQRTGATTYYLEILPTPWSNLGARRPLLALTPGVGDIDVMVASELMEAGRALAAGFITAERTLTIASTSRFYVMDEKIAMGDGRYDSARLAQAISEQSRARFLIDLDALARDSGAMINAVMLGAIAGTEALPIPLDAFEAAIRADGKAVEQNLRGFGAGLAAARDVKRAGGHVTPTAGAALQEVQDADSRGGPAVDERSDTARTGAAGSAASSLAALEREIERMPAAARETLHEGIRRLASYQDLAYARCYLDRLAPIGVADSRARADGRLLRAAARHLAVRMSYEDVIRVAQAKIDPQRMARIAAEAGLRPGEPYTVTEFLKPGIEELCSILPPWPAQKILALAERRSWLARAHWGMEVNSASVSGYLRFWLLAKLRRWRPRSHRFAHEQREIDRWLGLVAEAAAASTELALEIAECARLIKGYGDTHKRGSENYRKIEAEVIAPALAGAIPLPRAVDAIASARTAALLDPDGESLARCLGEIKLQSSTSPLPSNIG